jgi:hypothetical protein
MSHLRVERLESRYLLSLAPTSNLTTGADSFFQMDFAAQPIVVGSIVGPSGQHLASAQQGGHRVDLWIQPGLERPLLPSIPPSDSWPPLGSGGPAIPLPESPDLSDQGGPIDLGDLESHPGVPLVDGPGDSEARDVIAVLDALSYVPGVSAGAAARVLEAIPYLPDRAPPAAVLPPLEQEGGLVAVKRSELAEPEQPAPSAAALDAWLDRPVQMESKHGRFQAFEISTAEQFAPPAAQPPAAAPPECDASDAAAPPLPSPTAAETPANEDDLAWLWEPPLAAGEAAIQESETPEAEPGDEELLLAQPIPVDEPMSLAVSAAAAVLFASLTRAAQSAATDHYFATTSASDDGHWPRSKTLRTRTPLASAK